MRLIDADLLTQCVKKWIPSDKCGEETMEDSVTADLCVSMLMELEEQPTVDAVPVVRCKDCGYIGKSTWPDGRIFCHGGFYDPDCYCSKGVRKDGETQ